MARLSGCVAQQESCCWCWRWRGEAAPRTLGAGAEEEFLVVLFLYPLSDATRHQHQAGARQGMSFRQMCAGVHLLWILVPQKVASELHPKVRNHGEGPY